jgi:predicted DNA-binding ribbon-helix-helix protein
MKTKTSISIDRQVWAKLKNLAVERGVDISSLLQIAIDDELISNFEDSIMKFSTKGGQNWL